MCICFFDDGPIDKDPRANRGNMFKVRAPCKDPNSSLCHFYMRKKVLTVERRGTTASPRHRAGVASMAWRTTRSFSTNAKI